VLLRGQRFGHADDGEGETVAERYGDFFDDVIAAEFVEGDAGESGAHFKSCEAGGFGGVFAGEKKKGAEAAAGKFRKNEEGTDFGRVGLRIEELGFTDRGVVAAKESFAFAPTAGSGEDCLAGGTFCFDDEVCFIGDELSIEAKNGAESCFDLGRRIVTGLENANGRFDEGVKSGNIGVGGEADVERRGHRMMIRRKKR
jgi:hypothetical protein